MAKHVRLTRTILPCLGDGWCLHRDNLRSVAACQFGLVSSQHEFGLRGSRPNSTRPPHLERRSRRIGSGARACATSAECFCAGIGPWPSPARSKRSRSRTPPVLSYWREFGARYVTALCTRPDGETGSTIMHTPSPPDAELAWLALAAPPMNGAEYLTASVLQSLWQDLDSALGLELSESKCGV